MLSLNLLLILLFLIIWHQNFTHECSSSASQPNFSIYLTCEPVCFFYFHKSLSKPYLHCFAAGCLHDKMKFPCALHDEAAFACVAVSAVLVSTLFPVIAQHMLVKFECLCIEIKNVRSN